MNGTSPTLTIHEAAGRLQEVVNRVRSRHESAILTDCGIPVARIVPEEPRTCTVADLRVWWAKHERLDLDDADAFADDVRKSVESLAPPSLPWD